MDLILLLGGRGERMGTATRSLPKYLLEVDGQPLLVHVLDQIASVFGSGRVIMATGLHGETVSSKFGPRYAGLSLVYVQDERHLETRRRILSTKPLVAGPFLVVGTDVLAHGSILAAMRDRYFSSCSKGTPGVIAAADSHEPTHGHALVKITEGSVTEYLHHPPQTWTSDHSRDMHLYAFDHSFFEILEEAPSEHYWIERVIIWARSQGMHFAGEVYRRPWYHFAEPRDLEIKVNFERSTLESR